jgi:hypothetical protein
MNVELKRKTENGERSIRVSCADTARQPETIREWIEMLEVAERWLGGSKTRNDLQPGPKNKT